MKKEMTLIEAITTVCEKSEDSKMNENFFLSVKKEVSHIAKLFNITPVQAVLLGICVNNGNRSTDFHDISRHLNISNVAVLKYAPDLDRLLQLKLIRYYDAEKKDNYVIPKSVLNAIIHNEPFHSPLRKNLDIKGFFDQLYDIFDELDNNAIDSAEMQAEIADMLKNNAKLDFAKKMEAYKLNPLDRVLFCYYCHRLVAFDDNRIGWHDVEDLVDNRADFRRLKREFTEESHPLLRNGLVETCAEHDFFDSARFRLTDKAREEFLAEMDITKKHVSNDGLLHADSLAEKTLFYPSAVERQVNDLLTFLTPENYSDIHERMRSRGLRQGFACLFYGAPGTGKTETVYQLARQTGRDILLVDLPQIKSKWVGESEKNIKELFDTYREAVKSLPLAPILLFNEADAIIGLRMSGAERAVDKMENSIQNIILQEMETLDGIMIATTNLVSNLDPAFERRFLYKVRFEKPDAAVRKSIWQQLVADLSDSDALQLAKAYDFSGGQIENVSRKFTIDTILHGTPLDTLQTLTAICDHESLSSQKSTRIGF